MSELIYPERGSDHSLSTDKTCVGIDLGTTYSLMAVVNSENVDFSRSNKIPVQFARIPQHSPFEHQPTIEDEKVASIVAIHDGRPFVGNNLYHLKGHPDFQYRRNIFYHWKTEMGVDHHPMYPNAIIDKLDMPYKVAGGILKYMKVNYGVTVDQQLGNAVITVPASFQVSQRKDTLKAAEMAGITTESNMLIDEPNAAFLGYFNRLSESDKQNWASRVKNQNVLVIDFGGGTLDLSLLNVDFRKDTGITISNRAISRYNDLGGQDFDMIIAEEYLFSQAAAKIESLEGYDMTEVQQSLLPQLAIIAEDLKKKLSDQIALKAVEQDATALDLSAIQVSREDNILVLNNEQVDLGRISLNGEQFETLFKKIFTGKTYKFKYQDKTIRTISASINEILDKSELPLDEVHFALMVGGSSLNPFLAPYCSQKLHSAEILSSHEPDKLVAEGAAVYSYFLHVHHISLISPITSETLGVRLKGNRFFPLIERGQSLPQDICFPEFKLQNNLQSEVVIPVCINEAAYLVGEIRYELDRFYDINTSIKLKASVTADKVFCLQVYIDECLLGDAEFDNPYAIGQLSEDELKVYKRKSEMHTAIQNKQTKKERMALRDLIWLHNEVNNHQGTLESCEKYLLRFDDQDPYVWNMKYIANSRLGRRQAALNALEKAIEIEPNVPSIRYNYSLILEKEDPKRALEYLNNLEPSLKHDESIRIKQVLLKLKCDIPCEIEVQEIIRKYHTNPLIFSDHTKRVMLPAIFKHAGESYSYISPKVKKQKDDEGKYIDTKNLPI
ncbi:Hsp70 family protein [Zeaxanthinibacter sp. PT1]|uniref:Hsp70 family protein n=1 Tax=Zeaxanthinibacter TaxID=561554 RepID=UPI002349A399|nr:Hsp70 family protein [Zeaxanthinibacter sp. PT1]MDC6350476.1 Hsp70 family protein [Zeaxanthinibacter sp. PT1]